MSANKPIRSFKKLTLTKDTVLPTSTPVVPNSPGRPAAGAMSSSEYCSGSTACSTFYPC